MVNSPNVWGVRDTSGFSAVVPAQAGTHRATHAKLRNMGRHLRGWRAHKSDFGTMEKNACASG